MDNRKETLKLARKLIEKDPTLKDWVIKKFPELGESEDKKMMKAVLQFTKENVYVQTNYQGETITKKEMVDWLEKQIEAIDDSQPKFKVGDCWDTDAPILKFKEGDRINLIGREEDDYTILTVTSVNMDEKSYTCNQGTVIDFDKQGDWYVVNPTSGWWSEYDELMMKTTKHAVFENDDCSDGTTNKILEWLETVKKRISSLNDVKAD